MRPLSNAALLFKARRDARTLAGRGVDLRQSTRHITVDGQTALLLADLLDLPADFCSAVFCGIPVKRAEQIAAWALRERGFKRVRMLDDWAKKGGRMIPEETRVAAYEETRHGVTA